MFFISRYEKIFNGQKFKIQSFLFCFLQLFKSCLRPRCGRPTWIQQSVSTFGRTVLSPSTSPA